MNHYDAPDPCMEANWLVLESIEASGLATALPPVVEETTDQDPRN